MDNHNANDLPKENYQDDDDDEEEEQQVNMKAGHDGRADRGRGQESEDRDDRPLSLREAMNRLAEDFGDSFEALPWRGWLRNFQRFPQVDVSETDNEVRVMANVPGVDPDKIDINIQDDIITLRGEMDKEAEEKGEKLYRYEREYGSFRRQIQLPARVKPDQVSAKVKHGVLTIVLPKAESEKRRKIKIERE